MICLACGHEMVYKGIEDGFGESGDCICDVFECEFCGQEQEGHCECGEGDD